jgi:hypothetical protein
MHEILRGLPQRPVDSAYRKCQYGYQGEIS